jgi:hypothetical protein
MNPHMKLLVASSYYDLAAVLRDRVHLAPPALDPSLEPSSARRTMRRVI